MYIRDYRNIRLLLYRGNGLRRRHVGYGKADDVAAGSLKLPYLMHRCLNVVGLCIAHGLHRDSGSAAEHDAAHAYFLRFVSFIHSLTL